MTKTEPLEDLAELLEKEYGCSKQESYGGARSLVGLVELLLEIDQRQKNAKNEECKD